MLQTTKDTLRGIAFAAGCICLLISAGLLMRAYAEHNPYSDSDARPFSMPVKLDGSETHFEFTSTTKEMYSLSLRVNLPTEAAEEWVRYSCLMGSAPRYHTCAETGHFKPVWTIRDETDGNWHDWETNSIPSFEAIEGIGHGEIGWFTPVIHHHYVVTFRAEADVPAIRQSSASLETFFENDDTQAKYTFGNLFAAILAVLTVPFFAVGLTLVLAFRPRQKTSPN